MVAFWLAVAAVALFAALISCGAETPGTAPATVPPEVLTETQVPVPIPTSAPGVPPPSSTVTASLPTPAPTATLPATATPEPTPTPTAVPPTPYPTPDIPPPTPHTEATDWVKERLDAVIALYNPTPAGEALLRSLDLRQMRGEPGYFGSYGFGGWAGVGEAKPVPTMHELMHSYWGGFPVIGRPELDWEKVEGQDTSSGLASYHADVLAFMAQPPDDYEVLRQRFRNLPGLSAENTEPLFHNLEADLPQTTGGDLGLVPPILRKYWGHFLSDGPFHTWDQAVGWLQSLGHQDRSIAGGFLGFGHLDLRRYDGMPAYELPPEYLAGAAEALAGEERRRLTDLAEQFDLLLGDAQLEENFQFWRGYLSDKAHLHRRHPEHLASLGHERADEIADALSFLNGMGGSPEERASGLERQIPEQPFLVNFLPSVDNITLVELFARNPELPDAPTLQATASFVERLQRFASLAEGVLARGRESPTEGAAALQSFLDDMDPERQQDLRLFLDLFHDADPRLAHQVMAEVDKATVRELMPRAPVHLRNLLWPGRLQEKLDITANAQEPDLRRGITLLIDEPSGNYRIDEPFLGLLYEVMADRASVAPQEVLLTMAETPFPLEGMIRAHSEAAATVLGSDIRLAADLVEGSDPVVAPPARVVYRLVTADPQLAARLVLELERRGRSDLVVESLAYFAYDKARSERYPLLGISLAANGALLESLIRLQGEDWLRSRIGDAVQLYRGRVQREEVAPDFLGRYRETLEASAETLGRERGQVLSEVISRAFE